MTIHEPIIVVQIVITFYVKKLLEKRIITSIPMRPTRERGSTHPSRSESVTQLLCGVARKTAPNFLN